MMLARLPGPRTWREATVVESIQETPEVTTLRLDVADRPGHLPGQHVDVRLTAADGYQAARSYSIASPPEDDYLDITVEIFEDGEVSPYLAWVAGPDDRFEVLGPIGGHFVWTVDQGGPLLLIAGGSGIVPLMAMLRHRARLASTVPARLLYSARSFEGIIYREELDGLAAAEDGLEVFYTLTRSQPPDWRGFARRIDREMIESVAWPQADPPHVYICGPTPFVEAAAGILAGDLGYDPERVKTERFGPTG